ncbi:unnamed protein product [Dibothriocephalus latus]|uniref:Uncharacterized protein n=1 Tax=Dibothriocephalus latus TaxID=60516 RepID=A0A3P7LXD3_DIBLA|nr:unnamed protein product [Dibothriocephalus latus]
MQSTVSLKVPYKNLAHCYAPKNASTSDEVDNEQRVEVIYESTSQLKLDRSKIPPPISFNDFGAHIYRLNSEAALLDEFQALDVLTTQQAVDYGLTAAMATVETDLNRYADMTPCKFTYWSD